MHGEREAYELPWDLVKVITHRKFLNYVQQRLQQVDDFPPPTPATRASHSGMSAWEAAYEEERNLKSASDNYEGVYKRNDRIVPGRRMMFDHKIYAKRGEFVWWDSKEMKGYLTDEMPQEPDGRPENDVITEFTVLGA